MRAYLSGPSLGPLHTVLWSSRSRPRRRQPGWPRNARRFRSPLYWFFGIWAIEGAFWVLFLVVMAGAAGWNACQRRHQGETTISP